MNVTLPSGHVMRISRADFALLAGLNLHADVRKHTVYVRARKPGVRVGGAYVHNLIMGGMSDHRDGDGLNNMRRNLRRCTQQQNLINKRPKRGKRFVGVFLDKRRGTYYAQVVKDRKAHTRSGFASEEEAAAWRDLKAVELHGKWARLNDGYVPA